MVSRVSELKVGSQSPKNVTAMCACAVSTNVVKTLSHQTGHVISVFENSFNIKLSDGYIINIGKAGTHSTPRSIKVSDVNFKRCVVYPGQEVKCLENKILLSGLNAAILIDETPSYDPTLPVDINVLSKRAIINTLIETTKYEATGKEKTTLPLCGYFLTRYPCIVSNRYHLSPGCELPPRSNDFLSIIRHTLWKNIDIFLESLSQRRWEKLNSSVRNIVGLGSGLTPSGDDFLASFTSVAAIMPKLDNRFKDISCRLSKMVRDSLEGATNDISKAMLEDSINADLSMPAKDFIVTVLGSTDMEKVKECVCRLIHIGASSGNDSYNGLTTALCYFNNSTFWNS